MGLQDGRSVLRRMGGRPTLKAGETGLAPSPVPSELSVATAQGRAFPGP